MKISDLKPVSTLAARNGVKAIAYGPAGSGKTPLIQTAPRPVLLACEPGMLSMRKVDNIPAWDAYTLPRVKEFFDWFFGSAEAKAFDTLCIDSLSQLAEIVLAHYLPLNKDPRKAYGELSQFVMKYVNDLYFKPETNLYLICKQIIVDDNGSVKKPYFPGQDLNVKIPHLFDEIWHIAPALVPGAGPKPVTAVRCQPTYDILARDRSGNLAEFEQPNLTNIFNKAMQ
jgi:hypothetical protein